VQLREKKCLNIHYTQITVPQSTRLAVRDLPTFNDRVYNKHTQLIFVFSNAPTLPLGPTHSPSQWVPEALSSAEKRPESDAIPPLPHPPSWRSRGLPYLYYEMIPDYLQNEALQDMVSHQHYQLSARGQCDLLHVNIS
jgi:hypothetical protein